MRDYIKLKKISEEVNDSLMKEQRQGLSMLPMHHNNKIGKTGRPSIAEYVEYQERFTKHCQTNPDYEKRFGWPSQNTTQSIWRQLCLQNYFCQRLDKWMKNKIAKRYKENYEIAYQQAVVISLDRFLIAGKNYGYISYNDLFDTLCNRFSDHYILGSARIARDMSEDTVKSCRRDLLCRCININDIWRDVHHWSCNPLFKVEKVEFGNVTYTYVILKTTSSFDWFESIIKNDSLYTRPSGHQFKILFDPPQNLAEPKKQRQRICADKPYNIVALGEKSMQSIQRQEQVYLLFDIKAFQHDYKEMLKKKETLYNQLKSDGLDPEICGSSLMAKSKKKNWGFSARDKAINDKANKKRECLCNDVNYQNSDKRQKAGLDIEKWKYDVHCKFRQYDRSKAFVQAFQHIYEQIKDEKSKFKRIYTRFGRLLNGRYQPIDFWPHNVTSKDGQPDYNTTNQLLPHASVSYRKQWFKAEGPDNTPINLVGYDISSSQTQIIATLLGITTLETDAMNKPYFKAKMGKLAWQENQNSHSFCFFDSSPRTLFIDPYNDENDPRLQSICKHLWMRISYGGTVLSCVQDEKKNPEDFGRGWTKEGAEHFLKNILYKNYPEVETFLQACHLIASIAWQKDQYAGVSFTNPLDQHKIRWNPVQRVDKKIGNGACKLTLSLPGHKIKKSKKIELHQNHNKDYPVDKKKLTNMIAPCLIHMLDAYYSTLVMDYLADNKTSTFVGIHDCWLVPEKIYIDGKVQDGLLLLNDAMQKATATWYKGLGIVYTEIQSYLAKGEELYKTKEQELNDATSKIPSKRQSKKRLELKGFKTKLDEAKKLIDDAQTKWQHRVNNNDIPKFLAKPE